MFVKDIKWYTFFIFVLCVQKCEIEGARGGGGRRTGNSRPSSSYTPSRRPAPSPSHSYPAPAYKPFPSHPAPSHPSPASLSYPSHIPSNPPSAYKPFPSHPAPSNPSPGHNPSAPKPQNPSPGHKPFPAHVTSGNVSPNQASAPKPQNPSPGHNPSQGHISSSNVSPNQASAPKAPEGPTGSRPIGFVDPKNNPSGGVGTVRPIGFVPPGHNAPGGIQKTSVPGSNTHPQGPPTNYGTNQNAYHPAGYPAQPGYPSYPNQGYHPAGGYHPGSYNQNPGGYHPNPGGYHPNPGGYNPAQGGYHPQGGYNPGAGGYHGSNYPTYYPSGGNTKVKVVNVNNYHSPGYFAPASYPSYSYGTRDVGTGALGFFLGYSLARITTPTYYSHRPAFYDGYSPRYDHYDVHHYHHNRDSVPQTTVVQSNNIMACGGDSPSICPAGTVSLCTSNGQIMCVASAVDTVPCADKPNLRCVKSTVPCVNNEAPECKGSSQASPANVTVSIPCVSSASVYGNITYVNNTIVVDTPPENVTTTTPVPVTTMGNASVYPVTTTEVPTTLPPVRVVRETSDVAKQFCVTILATPAVRKPTDGEQAVEDVENVLSLFATKALGLD